jgi:glycosyltransferase involved in cell wall biosynthesis
MANTTISAVIITKNEEHTILRCIQSLLWCDEIVILDSLSTDTTKTLALNASPKVKFYESRFLGYGPQKQLAVSKANHEWILSIDADEVISPKLAHEITTTLQHNPNPKIAYKLARTLVFMNQKFHFSGEAKRPILRLFNKKYFNYNDANVHEEVIGTGKVLKLKQEMLHFSYKNWHDYVAKLNHYTDQMALKLSMQKSPKTAMPMIRFFTTFIKIYILKFAILDGRAGFSWAISSSFANMLKYLKYDEILASPSVKD